VVQDETRQELPSSTGRGLERRYAAALLVLLAIFVWRADQAPVWEWDMLGYLGCVEQLKGASPEEGHAAAYGAVEAEAPAGAAAELRGESKDTEGDSRGSLAYRHKLAEDPRAFEEQLPYYRGRVVYIGLLWAAEAAGVAPVRALRMISLLAGIAFGIVLALWLARYLPGFGAVLLTLPGLEWLGVGQAMSLATPDALAAALVFGGAYVLAETPRHVLGIALLILAVATRADHVLLAGAVLVWVRLAPEREQALSNRGLVAGLVMLALTLWFCTAGRGAHDWWTVFHHTFIEYKAFPASETPPRDIGFAISRVMRSLPMFRAFQPLLFSVLGIVALIVGWRRAGLQSRGALLALAAMAAGMAHFALFPALWPRLMMPYWAVTLMGLCAVLSEPRGDAQPRADQASP
jgi:hypothetical protein